MSKKHAEEHDVEVHNEGSGDLELEGNIGKTAHQYPEKNAKGEIEQHRHIISAITGKEEPPIFGKPIAPSIKSGIGSKSIEMPYMPKELFAISKSGHANKTTRSGYHSSLDSGFHKNKSSAKPESGHRKPNSNLSWAIKRHMPKTKDE